MRLLLSCLVLAGALLAPSLARADDGPAAPETRMANPAVFATGVTLVAVGGVTTVVGGLVYGALASLDSYCPLGGTGCARNETPRDVAGAVLLGGVAAVLIGVPMWIVGAKQRPVTLSVAPTFSASGGGVGLVGRF